MEELQKAIKTNNMEVIKAILSNPESDINGTWENNGIEWTPLLYAANGGHLEISKLLIDYGADISQMSNSDKTPLDIAIIRNHTSISKFLKQAMKPWSPTHHHLTPRKIRSCIDTLFKVSMRKNNQLSR